MSWNNRKEGWENANPLCKQRFRYRRRHRILETL